MSRNAPASEDITALPDSGSLDVAYQYACSVSMAATSPHSPMPSISSRLKLSKAPCKRLFTTHECACPVSHYEVKLRSLCRTFCAALSCSSTVRRRLASAAECRSSVASYLGTFAAKTEIHCAVSINLITRMTSLRRGSCTVVPHITAHLLLISCNFFDGKCSNNNYSYLFICCIKCLTSTLSNSASLGANSVTYQELLWRPLDTRNSVDSIERKRALHPRPLDHAHCPVVFVRALGIFVNKLDDVTLAELERRIVFTFRGQQETKGVTINSFIFKSEQKVIKP